ncbi:MAG: FIST C-terminal domain-containing protein [Deferribacteraceae bacterium]|jgi:hypothetical protein|nr:FIST C-terminal domain-containing protein [Deferribacteraceae bacterium]
MIRLLTAHTTEIEDEDLALEELERKLDLKNRLLKNSFALVFRNKYFSDETFYNSLAAMLKIEFVVASTILSATDGASGGASLSISVLTSDNVKFISGFSEYPSTPTDIADLYHRLAEQAPPKAIFLFHTLPYDINGSEQVKILDEISGGLPIFGSVSYDPPDEERGIFYNGAFRKNCLFMLLSSGDFELSLSYLTTPIAKILEKDLVITKAEGAVLKELNGKPAVQYLKDAGIICDGMNPIALTIMPLCSANNGHGRRIWVMVGVCDNGDILCGTELTQGEVVSIGLFEQHIVLNSLVAFLEENVIGKKESFLIFSCSVRSLTLGFSFDEEADYISQKLDVPYLFAYSAGEYCYSPDGNRYLNASVIACGFKES